MQGSMDRLFSPARRRRTAEHSARPGGRSERVVREVLRAVAAELARSGYAALRVEDVAMRAGVNKTTIYRRWPTKAELVAAALRSLGTFEQEVPDNGSLRSELLCLLRRFIASMSTPEGQGAARMILVDMDQPEVAAIVQSIRGYRNAAWLTAIERAVARGEIPAGSNAQLIIDTIFGPISNRLFRLHEAVDEDFLAAVVDLVLVGANSGGALCSSASPSAGSVGQVLRETGAASLPAPDDMRRRGPTRE
jgi:AcrR family transcriptional regulator